MTREENILLNAEKLFAVKGFSGTSTREIAQAAQVNISMISYYFGSKEKLYEEIFKYRMKEGMSFATNVLENEQLDAWQKLTSITVHFHQRIRDLSDYYQILQREQIALKRKSITVFVRASKKSFIEIYQKIISDGLKTKLFTKSPRIELVHATIAGTLFAGLNGLPIYREFSAGNPLYDQDFNRDLDQHLHDILAFLLGYHKQ